MGATYIFGEDCSDMDLTAASGLWSNWPSGNTYVIAGDCYVPDDSTLTLEVGVTVTFDYDYDGDLVSYPIINAGGALVCDGSSNSYVRFTNYSGTSKGELRGVSLNGAGTYEGVLEADYTIFEYGGKANGVIAVDTMGCLNSPTPPRK